MGFVVHCSAIGSEWRCGSGSVWYSPRDWWKWGSAIRSAGRALWRRIILILTQQWDSAFRSVWHALWQQIILILTQLWDSAIRSAWHTLWQWIILMQTQMVLGNDGLCKPVMFCHYSVCLWWTQRRWIVFGDRRVKGTTGVVGTRQLTCVVMFISDLYRPSVRVFFCLPFKKKKKVISVYLFFCMQIL